MSKPINSNKEITTQSRTGLGFCGALFLLFLTLKLLGVTVVASWSWWWVTAPLWIPFLFWLVVLVIALLVFVIVRSRT